MKLQYTLLLWTLLSFVVLSQQKYLFATVDDDIKIFIEKDKCINLDEFQELFPDLDISPIVPSDNEFSSIKVECAGDNKIKNKMYIEKDCKGNVEEQEEDCDILGDITCTCAQTFPTDYFRLDFDLNSSCQLVRPFGFAIPSDKCLSVILDDDVETDTYFYLKENEEDMEYSIHENDKCDDDAESIKFKLGECQKIGGDDSKIRFKLSNASLSITASIGLMLVSVLGYILF